MWAGTTIYKFVAGIFNHQLIQSGEGFKMDHKLLFVVLFFFCPLAPGTAEAKTPWGRVLEESLLQVPL